MRVFGFWCCALLLLPTHAAAQDYARLNRTLVEEQLLPGYAAFVTAAEALRQETAKACEAEPQRRQAAYHAAADAWQRVQHFRFGPAQAQQRALRIAFWPDPRNRVGQQLEALLQAGEAARLEPGEGSAAVQGLPALELLLFTEAGERPGACRLAAAVAAGLAGLAGEILAEWREGYAAALLEAGAPGSPYGGTQEATLELFKSLHLAVELVADHKLARPLGASAAQARPRLAEAWRSGRSLRNILLNLEAAEALYDGGFAAALREAGQEETAALFDRAFAQTLATARGLERPFAESAGDLAARAPLERLAKETAALKTLLARRLAPALGLPLGFNALDGD